MNVQRAITNLSLSVSSVVKYRKHVFSFYENKNQFYFTIHYEEIVLLKAFDLSMLL